MKFKILGIALLACAATSAFAVTNASGTANGHFTHEGPKNEAVITGHEGITTEHFLHFKRLSANSHAIADENGIVCETSEYTGKVDTKTVTTIRVFPVYQECKTTNGTYGEVKIDTHGCSFTFHSQGTRPHGTVTVECPVGKQITITHPNCTINVPAQTTASTLTEGINYTTTTEKVGGVDVHTLTADVTVNTITGHFEGGLCVFLGTNHKFKMEGSVTVRGFNYISGTTPHNLVHGAQIGITST